MNRDEWDRAKCSICGCVDLAGNAEDFKDFDGETYCYDCDKKHEPSIIDARFDWDLCAEMIQQGIGLNNQTATELIALARLGYKAKTLP